jgi:hypothetical protein
MHPFQRLAVWVKVLRNLYQNYLQYQQHEFLRSVLLQKIPKSCSHCGNINPINQINDPELFKIKNEVGKITLFQNNIPHYTTPHKGLKERITVAFDMIYDSFPVDKTNMILLDET